jgi:hypothetical protein
VRPFSKHRTVFVGVSAVLALGCTKNSLAPSTPTYVYIAGEMGNRGVLWNSGSTLYLPDTSNGPSHASDVFVSGTDVYVCGDEYKGNYRLATIWLNGVPSSFASPTLNSTISSIFVSASDIYAIGIGYNSFGGTIYLLYWKNGVASILDSNSASGNIFSNPSAINCIYVSGSDVYIGGNNHVSGCYWTNGVATNLNASSCTSLFVSGSDVYAVANTSVNGFSIPTYWKNAVPVSLPAPSNSNGYAQSIFVSGSDIYVAGEQVSQGIPILAVWKNDVLLPLQGQQTDTTYIQSMYVSGSDVYVAGEQQLNGGFVSVYWKNGMAIPLAGTNSLANSIFVQ